MIVIAQLNYTEWAAKNRPHDIEPTIKFQLYVRSKIYSAYWNLNHFWEINMTFVNIFKILMRLKLRCVVCCTPYLDILNRFGVVHECDRRTDRRNCDSNSNV